VLFVETSAFSALLEDWLSDEKYRGLQSYLIERPDAGDIIRGSGGMRKLRWTAKGKGKSGGVRVIYYWAKAPDQIYLLTLYGKSERADIDRATLKRIGARLELLDK
jgi:mRNA-degrading endonuclease RelE of RelBE toxin-antitoxin system